MEEGGGGGRKWEGKTRAKVRGARADQIWPFLQDFCNFHRWAPFLDSCEIVEGVAGQPGCVRYSEGTSISPTDGSGVSWAKEKLLAVDPIGRSLSYEVVDGNIGFGAYVATFSVLPAAESDCDGAGCTIEWSFIADPVEGWTQEGLLSYLDSSLQVMAKRMEDAVTAAAAAAPSPFPSPTQ